MGKAGGVGAALVRVVDVIMEGEDALLSLIPCCLYMFYPVELNVVYCADGPPAPNMFPSNYLTTTNPDPNKPPSPMPSNIIHEPSIRNLTYNPRSSSPDTL